MIYIGEFNTLKAKRQTDNGYYLVCPEDEEVLLPNKYVPNDFAIDDLLEVFVYTDSEDRPVATTIEPKAIAGEFGFLECKDVSSIGAFVDLGLEKDLFVPFKEQRLKMEKGRWYVIYVYLDERSGRIAGSNKFNKYIKDIEEDYEVGQQVDLLIASESELGYTAIIDDHAKGLLYHQEIHQELRIGQRIQGYIKSIRDDKKVDLCLQKDGYEHVDASVEQLLEDLRSNNGSLQLNDKSTPDQINAKLGISKKVFKKAVGALYKKKLITITDDGIQLVTDN